MKVLHESNFLKISYEEEGNFLFNEWLAPTGSMTEEEFQYEVLKQSEFAIKHNVDAFLTDTRNFSFSISPELQTWVDEQVFKTMTRVGVKKLALLLGPDFYASLSIEQLIDDAKDNSFVTHYFDAVDKAVAWIRE